MQAPTAAPSADGAPTLALRDALAHTCVGALYSLVCTRVWPALTPVPREHVFHAKLLKWRLEAAVAMRDAPWCARVRGLLLAHGDEARMFEALGKAYLRGEDAATWEEAWVHLRTLCV